MASPSSIAVILNAGAGAAKSPAISAELRDLFRAVGREAEIVALRQGQNPLAAAREASARAAVVVAAGGDGTGTPLRYRSRAGELRIVLPRG